MSLCSDCSFHAGDPLHEGVGGVKAEVIAQVKSSVRFRGMADFQYVSCDTRPQAKQVPTSHICSQSLALAPCNSKHAPSADSHDTTA